MFATLQINQRVGDLVAAHPGAARVFENAGIDYCCAGKTTLADACAPRCLDPVEVLAQIERAHATCARAERDWTTASMTELADHIESTHHEYVKSELPRLERLMSKVLRSHGDRKPELAELSEVFAELHREMIEHMYKEEHILFPALRSVEAAGAGSGASMQWVARGPIRCLMMEHESAGRALARMRELTHGYEATPQTCATHRVMLASLAQFEGDMHQHVHKENNILFPMASRLLGTEELNHG